MNDVAVTAFRRQPLWRWFVVALLLIGATACGYLVDHHVSLTSQAMVYVLAVVIASYTLSWKESIVCAVGAVTAFNFFFVPPRLTFQVDSQEHLIALFTMLLVALVISHLAAGMRRETESARLNAQRAGQLQKLATELASATTPDEIAVLGRAALKSEFDGQCLLALGLGGDGLTNGGELPPAMSDAMQCCMKEAAVLGPGTGRWPGLDAWYLPLGTKGQMSGAVCVAPALAGDTAGREHAQALCSLLGQALWRARLTSSMLTAQHEAQRQQVQSTFLAAISHDLRTPLAAVIGAASSLQTQHDKLSRVEQDRLLSSIVSEATYLSNVTDNTLQLVRLTSSIQVLKQDWESMEEIVGAVLARVRQRDPSRRIKSKVPEKLPLIKADPVLLAQLIGNLLDNALQYSSDAIELGVSASDHELQVCIKDRGPGIPQEQVQTLFEPFSHNDHSGQRGAGLGLAVCHAIAVAHGGSLTFRRRTGGGSTFALTLPLNKQQPQREQT
ncbi:MAG: ATP-binding protein [Comamonadaceae bacterium]